MENLRATLEQCFLDYRAENLYQVFGDIFVKPPFFDDLAGASPCFLIGGRGTGKTTALKSLRFDATLAEPRQYLGIYIRINKNQVHCFQSDRHQALMQKAFAHYVNLLVAQECTRLLAWMSRNHDVSIAHTDILPVTRSLAIADVGSLPSLCDAVAEAIQELELFVNNVDALYASPPLFSVAESPVRAIAHVVNNVDPLRRPLLCCIDEYENLLEYQQAALNTYVKHSEMPLSYKVGMKADGLKTRRTITDGDPLRTPADYREIDISQSLGRTFFEEILRRRMRFARREGIGIPDEVDDFLVPLDRLEEATMLGAETVAEGVRAEVAGDADVSEWAGNIPDGDLILIRYRADVEQERLLTVAKRYRDDEKAWRNIKNNHGFPSLFWLSLGRRGARRRKFYCGMPTILKIASGNVRFFLELVGDALKAAMPDDLSLPITITPAQQSDAARAVATRQLEQLDSLGRHGGKLKRMVLGIGKVFFELTRRPGGKMPEPTSFVLSGSPDAVGNVRRALTRGIANLVFASNPRTKATSDVEIRDEEYSLHPILAAFFEVSYRKKRRITLNAEHLRMLQGDSKTAMALLLKNVDQTPSDDLPEQLAIFSALYGGN